MNDATAEAELAVLALDTCVHEIRTIKNTLAEEMPEVMEALAEAERDLPDLQEAAKKACRKLGSGNHNICGHYISVNSAATKTEVDTEGLIERATELGEIEDLLKAGVLRYEVVPHQIARLQAKQRVRYEGYLKAKVGAAAVQLPAELK